VWQAVPYIAITTFAAQSQINPEILEAATIDGASPFQQYWKITVPLIAPHLTAITILSFIWDMNAFNQIWLLTMGGPGSSTSTLGVYTYKKAFINFSIGQGSAIAVVTTLILFAITGLYIKRLLENGEKI
ncbi:MAG: sugar ABC transporter permease, partial [Bifidobacteriaceae bacterium]|nr:sugar ABC transporter permease [Bifidobacteriaceae bacterium]